MKTIEFFFKLLLPLGLMAILFQGCYTQFVPTREEDLSYQKEQQSAVQSDSSYYGEDNDNWQSHQCLGFSYYYPAWRSYWLWDYGCVYPTYWDPWFWGPAFYIGYSYYPYHWGYWNSYSGYGYRHSNYPRSFVTRNSGYQRGGNSRLTGTARSGYAGIGTTFNGRVETSRGGVNLPRTAGSVSTQSGSAVTTRASRSSSRSVSTVRQRGSWYSPSVQQPRHRDQSTTAMSRSSRTGNSHNRVYSRSQGSSNGQSRSSGRSYSPQPSTRTSSTSSAPASRNDGGGGRQSGGSGKSR
ncbi:MAG: hypothetical protein ABSC53_02680 [Bacteroidota bacterium]